MIFIISRALKFTGKKQLQVLPLKSIIVMKTVRLTSPNVIQNIIESGNLQIDSYAMPVLDRVIPNNKLKYATIKTMSNRTIDASYSVLLVCEVNDGIENYKGIIGTLWVLRGSKDMLLYAVFFSITCLKAYDSIKGLASNGNKVGKCIWNGKEYIAVALRVTYSVSLLFSGFYTDDCVFKNVLESEVTWL